MVVECIEVYNNSKYQCHAKCTCFIFPLWFNVIIATAATLELRILPSYTQHDCLTTQSIPTPTLPQPALPRTTGVVTPTCRPSLEKQSPYVTLVRPTL